MKRQRSSKVQFRQRIPKDVLDEVRGSKLNIPVGPGTVAKRIGAKANEIVLSLGTRDPGEARLRHAVITAYLERVYAGLRQQAPIALSHQQCVALAGDFYRGWASSRISDDLLHGGDLGPDALEAMWLAVSGKMDKWSQHDNHHLRARIERFLTERGIGRVIETSMEVLTFEVVRALKDSFELQAKKARGDYSPDPNAARFPEWNKVSPRPRTSDKASAKSAASCMTLSDLLSGWSQKSKKPRAGTIEAFRSAIHHLKQHLGHEDLSRITAEDIIGWKDAMVAEGKLSAKTINEKRIAGIRALYGWGLDRSNLISRELRKLTAGENIASGIRVEERKRRERSKAFTADEARKVLKASLTAEADAGHGTRQSAIRARRWAPWICCYTGARIAEVLQLRRQDVRQVEGIWIFDITPEAGETKNDKARIVPVHSDLIGQGFIAFVQGRPEGPLFLEPPLRRPAALKPRYSRSGKRILVALDDAQVEAPNDGKQSPTPDAGGRITEPLRRAPQVAASRLAEWVRSEKVGVTDLRIQPNHAWRHWFINQCRANGVDKEARYFMVGHAEGEGRSDIGNAYGDALVPFLKRELEKIPAFNVAGS